MDQKTAELILLRKTMVTHREGEGSGADEATEAPGWAEGSGAATPR